MSHLEKALEKAKKQREVNHRQEVAGPTVSPPSPTYVHTRIIPIEERHLIKNRLATLSSHPIILDRYNLLRTQILQNTRDNGSNTILVTSVNKGEGKTLTAINLALSISRELSHTVLLVDADLKCPTIAKFFGLAIDKGLSDYLMYGIPLLELLVNPGIGKLTILPGGKGISHSTELLGSPRMAELVKEIKGRYPDRYIIFDSPPILSSADTLVFSSYVDSILLVVEAGKTSSEQIKEAMVLLKGKHVLGTVLNKAEIKEKDYY